MSRILITGAAGFVGRELVAQLRAEGTCRFRLALRGQPLPSDMEALCEHIQVGDIGGNTNWDRALDDVSVVVHLAARAHIVRDYANDPLLAFRETNLHGTKQLALVASKRGVKRFIYVSSIGVNGLQTKVNKPFTELDEPHPHNAYAISKWEAEESLKAVSQASDMEFVIIRPPLVYGKDAPGNFGQLVRMVRAGIPLPLAAVHNLRSFVALDNLVDFILVCCRQTNAANQTFLVADGHDVSTPDLIAGIARGSGRQSCLFPVPLWVLTFGAALMGQRAALQRLCGNLQLDISKARNLLDWTPPVSVEEGLRRATLPWQK